MIQPALGTGCNLLMNKMNKIIDYKDRNWALSNPDNNKIQMNKISPINRKKDNHTADLKEVPLW